MTSTPDYPTCTRCGCRRPAAELDGTMCRDTSWCFTQVELRKARTPITSNGVPARKVGR